MVKEIKNIYETFSDALILEISYKAYGNNKNIEVTLHCMNKLKDYEFETIKISCIDVLSCRFIEGENQSSTLITSALLEEINGIILFDFFPLIYGDNLLKENENSDFKIKCRNVIYSKIE